MTDAVLASRPSGYLRGIAMVAAAGVMWSLGGLLFRLIEDASVWQIVAYRTTFMWVTMGAWLAWRYRGDFFRRFRAIGLTGLLAAVAIAAANICYMFSLSMTWVANTNLILGASPLITALMAWVVLRETVRPATLIAMVAVVAGIAVMVGGGLGSGRWHGDLLALGAVTAFSTFAVCVRAGSGVDMLPAAVIGTMISSTCGITLALSGGEGLSITLNDLVITALMGTIQMTLGMILFISGAKNVPAAELAMLSLTEVIFGPIWVAVLLDEVPVTATFIGGGLVLVGIVFNAATGIRRRHPMPQV